jgi:hypothetical protein
MTQETELQKALDFLCGLHPCVTAENPMHIAEQIFGSVMAERRELQREVKRLEEVIAGRDELIRQMRRKNEGATK